MKKLSTKKQMQEFVEYNEPFLNFLYMEGIGEGKKGYVIIEVDENLEIMVGGFEQSDRKGIRFKIIKKENEKNAERKRQGYYRINDLESGETLCNIRRVVDEKNI
ncbi:MAG: hypothetical protein WDO19_20110 [Bacteroidota bacterium]